MPSEQGSKLAVPRSQLKRPWPIATRLGLVEVILAAAALLLGFLAWWFPRNAGPEPTQEAPLAQGASGVLTPSGPVRSPGDEQAGQMPQDGLAEPSIGSSGPQPSGAGSPRGGSPGNGNMVPSRLGKPFEPIELQLRSGEQRVILSGLVGLSIEQSAVGEMKVLTVRITPSGEAPQNHGFLNGGGRVEFHAGGRTYVVSVLSWDEGAGQAVLRVDQTG